MGLGRRCCSLSWSGDRAGPAPADSGMQPVAALPRVRRPRRCRGTDAARDLHVLLERARVPGPYALERVAKLTGLGDRPLFVVTAGTGSAASWAAEQGDLATLSRWSAGAGSATVYAFGLVLIASVYVGFAVADGRPKVMAAERNP
jgi:hypothetical protein